MFLYDLTLKCTRAREYDLKVIEKEREEDKSRQKK